MTKFFPEKRRQGRPATGRKHKPLSIAVTDEQLAKIKFIAARDYRSTTFVVREMIDKALSAEK